MSESEQSHATDISMATEVQSEPEVAVQPKATAPSGHTPPQPDAPLSNLAPNEIKVFSAPITASSTTASGSTSNSQTPAATELDDTYFEPSLSDVQSYHATVISRSKRLNEAPLLTSKHRDEDRLAREKKKAEKWPTTTIRIKFSDGTQIQSTFASTSAIQPVYAFVRTALQPEAATKPFTLWQPPRFSYPEHPPAQPSGKKPAQSYTKPIIPPANYGYVRGGPTAGLMGGQGGKESLNDLGLVPQSVLMVKWEDEAMNVTGYPAPLLPELMEKVVPLPPAAPKDADGEKEVPASSSGGARTGEKKIPKWLQKGLMKRK